MSILLLQHYRILILGNIHKLQGASKYASQKDTVNIAYCLRMSRTSCSTQYITLQLYLIKTMDFSYILYSQPWLSYPD